MGNESNNGKVPLISKIAYGFGDVGCNFSWMFVSNFLMIFYTDVFGISMAVASYSCSNYSNSSRPFFLGTSGLVKYSEDYLYGNNILPSRVRIHLCKYSIWNTLRCYDTGY